MVLKHGPSGEKGSSTGLFPGTMASSKEQGMRCGRKDVILFHMLALLFRKIKE